MEKTKDLIRIAKELNKLYLSKKQALPYSINIIRELHATENANSRILRGLLQYSPNGQYPILHSFIELMESVADCVIDISIMAPELSNEEGRIDLLIKEKNSYAIVVENKIWNAIDQKSQIERYIDYVDGLGIPRRKIFVVYLTLDGNKNISDTSLTDRARKNLGCSTKSNGRFICLNFKNDIMPWLNTLKNFEDIKEEPLLSSAIIQYSDYLEGLFDARKEDIEIENELEIQLMEKLQIESLQELLQTWEDVDKLWDIVSSEVNSRINSICKNKICNALEKKGYHIRESQFQYEYFDLEVDIPEWKKCWWAMESDHFLFSGIWRNPKEKVAKKYITMLNDCFDNSDDDYLGWNWHKEYELNDAFWIHIESHSTKFVNFIVNEIERVREATKDMRL